MNEVFQNDKMKTYDFIEGTEFEGLMPSAAAKIGTVGASEEIVEFLGAKAKGMDALEVVDIEAAFKE